MDNDLGGEVDIVDKEQVAEELEKPHTYTQLIAENQKVEGGKKWSSEWLRTQYVQCTDGLIGKFDGTIPLTQRDVYIQGEDGLVQEKRDLLPPSAVIYLDKSARPVEWLVRSLWPVLARTPGTPFAEGEVPERPDSYFLNIDKMDWLRRMGLSVEHLEDPPAELVDFNKIPKEKLRNLLARIRALYSTAEIDEDNLDDAWNHPTKLDGQHVMIIDEIRSSGQTLSIAQKLLAMAIPEGVFSGEYWATPKMIALNKGAPVNGKIQFKREWVPVWYSDKIASGRGVSGRDPRWPESAQAQQEHPVSRFTRLGRHILSTPPHDPKTHARVHDVGSVRLRADIHQLAEDVQQHRLLYCPSGDRPFDADEDFKGIEERIMALNDVKDFDDWRSRRDALEPKPAH